MGVGTPGTCKDCGYWEHHVDMLNRQWGTCELPEWVGRFDKIPEDGVALFADAADDTGLTAGLKTGPMFGCVKFKAKSKKRKPT